jgi:hypothetical protein
MSLLAGVLRASRAKAAGRVRIDVKYGRDRERGLAAIRCGPAGQLIFAKPSC